MVPVRLDTAIFHWVGSTGIGVVYTDAIALAVDDIEPLYREIQVGNPQPRGLGIASAANLAVCYGALPTRLDNPNAREATKGILRLYYHRISRTTAYYDVGCAPLTHHQASPWGELEMHTGLYGELGAVYP